MIGWIGFWQPLYGIGLAATIAVLFLLAGQSGLGSDDSIDPVAEVGFSQTCCDPPSVRATLRWQRLVTPQPVARLRLLGVS
jgi:hypothetical protein